MRAANVGSRCRSRPSLMCRLRDVVESCVLHAASSPAAALSQPLVTSSSAAFFVLCNCGAKMLDQSPAPMLAAGACWCLRIVICSVAVLSAQPSSPIMPLFNLRPSMIPCSHKPRRTCSAVAFASSVFGVSQLVLHERNGLLEIFLSMCASSAPAPSCRHARRQQAGYAAAAALLAEWRARPSPPQSPRLHSNPSLALPSTFFPYLYADCNWVRTSRQHRAR